MKLKTHEIEKSKYDNNLKILNQQQQKEESIIKNYTDLIATINKTFDINSPFSFDDNKIKITFDYNNNLLIKENLNNTRIQEEIDNLIVSIYDKKNKYILNNNINVIKNIFFSYKKLFIINKKKYIIFKIKDISRGFNEDLNFKDENQNIKGKYSFTIELTIARHDGKPINIDFMKLSCLEKGKNLQLESNKLFNMSSNYITDIMKPIIPPDSNNNEYKRELIHNGGKNFIKRKNTLKKKKYSKKEKLHKKKKYTKKEKYTKN
jgi:hypothetical protein